MAIILNVICEKNSRELVFLFISRISQATVGKSFECSFKKIYCSQRFLPALYTKIIDVVLVVMAVVLAEKHVI